MKFHVSKSKQSNAIRSKINDHTMMIKTAYQNTIDSKPNPRRRTLLNGIHIWTMDLKLPREKTLRIASALYVRGEYSDLLKLMPKLAYERSNGLIGC